MREIKFKLWDKRRGKWLSDYSISSYDKVLDLYEELDCKREDSILVQYTGLKDKNEKEIYEGDVVEGFKETSESCYNVKSHVYFQDGCPTVRVDKNYHPCLYECSQLKIIGNIYENPELIK